MSGICIRPCDEKDKELYISMNLEFIESVRKEHPFWNDLKFPTEKEMEVVFHEAMGLENHIKIFMIDYGNKPIGYINTWCVYSIWSMGKSLIIDDLFIRPEYRNNGFGRKVMNDLIHYGKSKGFKRIQLNAEKDNFIARKLYESAGFSGEEMIFFKKNLNVYE